jgi:type II intron maturase
MALKRRQQSQRLLSVLLNDPGFRRLHYLQYADDFLRGYVGTHREAEPIKHQIGEFLRNKLHLELSEEKTLITHGRTEAARFLGYEIVVLQDDRKRTANRRSINGAIGLKVSRDVIEEKGRPYTQAGQPIHRIQRIHDTEFTLVYQYQQVYRGIGQYDQLAYNLHQLDKLKWGMEQSLTQTVARKLQISSRHVFDGHVRVNTVLIEQIDGIDLESLERALGGLFDVLRPTIQARRGPLPLRIKVEPELGGDHYLLTAGSKGFAHELFVRERTVDFGGVEECDAAFDGQPDHGDHLLLVRSRTVAAAHSHAAEPESRNLKAAVSKFARLHFLNSCL